MSRSLPARPNVEHLKNQAKDLLQAMREGVPDAIERFRPFETELRSREPRLTDAQLIVAREYGFASWLKLTQHVESLGFDPAGAFASAITTDNVAAATRVLEKHPELRSTLNDALPGGDFGATALHVAVDHKSRAMIDLLLRFGADINAKTHWWAGGFSVLETTALDFAPFLLERGVPMNIHGAARLGRLADVERLVAENPDLVHARGGDGQTALHFASTVDIARYLLDHGAAIDALCVDHESTPAQWMIRDRQDVVRFLVSRGCRTDILMASALGDVERVQAFLDADPASINVSVSNRYFPRRGHHAAATIYTWTLGANKTAHVVAHDFGHHDVFELLMSRSPDSLKLTLACELGDTSMVDAIRAAHPKLAAGLTEEERRTLVTVAEANNAEAVELMLAAGWPVGQRGDRGQTVLHWAGFHGNARMARDTLRYHPPLETEESAFHGTPLGWALHGSLHGWHRDTGDYAGTVAALLDAGAQMPTKIEASETVIEELRRRKIL
ncbi:MAG: ankyrin repeat domain-containing protein [bacterium]